MPVKKLPLETERERRERIELIGRQIAHAIKLDGEAKSEALEQGSEWHWR